MPILHRGRLQNSCFWASKLQQRGWVWERQNLSERKVKSMDKAGFITEQQLADELGMEKGRLAEVRKLYNLRHVKMGHLILYHVETLQKQLFELLA